jgi:hypothetical protein
MKPGYVISLCFVAYTLFQFELEELWYIVDDGEGDRCREKKPLKPELPAAYKNKAYLRA